MMADAIKAEREEERVNSISEALEFLQHDVEDNVEMALDALVQYGVFTSRWGSSADRQELCKRAARAALRAILEDGQANPPNEIVFVYDDAVRTLRNGVAALDRQIANLADERFDAGYRMALLHALRVCEVVKQEGLSTDAIIARIGLRLPDAPPPPIPQEKGSE